MCFYDDFGTDIFTIINSGDADIPEPYQIKISDNLPKKFEITWTYPQPRKLTKFLIDLELIYLYVSYSAVVRMYVMYCNNYINIYVHFLV